MGGGICGQGLVPREKGGGTGCGYWGCGQQDIHKDHAGSAVRDLGWWELGS